MPERLGVGGRKSCYDRRQILLILRGKGWRKQNLLCQPILHREMFYMPILREVELALPVAEHQRAPCLPERS